MTGGVVVEPPPPPPQPGTSATAAITPSRAKFLALPFTKLQRDISNITRSPNEIVSKAPGPMPLNGELTNPDVGAGCELERAVVEIVSITVVGVAPLTVTDAEGENAHVAAVGTPLVQANVTVPLKLFTADAVRLNVAG